MKKELFVQRSRIEAPAADVFRWHARPGAFERCNPPWNPVKIIERSPGVAVGATTTITVPIGPFRKRWVAEHVECEDGRLFRDVQRSGPFASWDHLHVMEPEGPDACFLEDRVEYALPMGALGRFFAGKSVRRQLERTFAYRHETLKHDMAAQRSCRGGSTGTIVVSGASGMVGSALIPLLTTGGHPVRRLVRKPTPTDADAIAWDPATGAIDPAKLDGVECLVHLAGDNIASGRWTAAKKARILESRAAVTRKLCDTLARMDHPPKTLVSASAIGFYGNRGDEILTEDSGPGTGFLADVCRQWEEATRAAVEKGMRVVNLRFGVILDPRGGALAKMLFPFRMCGGGVIGDGRQAMSWITLDDAVGAIHHALHDERMRGPVNGVAPNPVGNREFTKTLGGVLRRPAILPMPAFAARLAFGEMADALLLASARVHPTRLLAGGYVFRHAKLEDGLRHLLGRRLRSE